MATCDSSTTHRAGGREAGSLIPTPNILSAAIPAAYSLGSSEQRKCCLFSLALCVWKNMHSILYHVLLCSMQPQAVGSTCLCCPMVCLLGTVLHSTVSLRLGADGHFLCSEMLKHFVSANHNWPWGPGCPASAFPLVTHFWHTAGQICGSPSLPKQNRGCRVWSMSGSLGLPGTCRARLPPLANTNTTNHQPSPPGSKIGLVHLAGLALSPQPHALLCSGCPGHAETPLLHLWSKVKIGGHSCFAAACAGTSCCQRPLIFSFLQGRTSPVLTCTGYPRDHLGCAISCPCLVLGSGVEGGYLLCMEGQGRVPPSRASPLVVGTWHPLPLCVPSHISCADPL